METLPPEMVMKISRDLTLKDLARCCAVSREWRDTFDQDWLWESHCDPALVEPLDTTPCVVEPGFVSPEGESSTLTPICHWRLAFLKQQHLWKNLKQGKCKKEDILELDNEVRREFLTNTLLVRWCSDRVEVWDVSVIPATFVARTDLEGVDYSSVFGTHGLVVQHKSSVKVFHVDPIKKPVIEMKHEIPLGNLIHNSWVTQNLVKGSIYVHVSDKGSRLNIIDLEEGKKIKTDPSPVTGNENNKAKMIGVKGSPTSDHVIVLVFDASSPAGKQCHCHVYSLGKLVFLRGPVVKNDVFRLECYAILQDYLAVGDYNLEDSDSLKVFNCHTSKCIFKEDFMRTIYPHAFNDSFIFVDDHYDKRGSLVMVSPSNKTWMIISLVHEVQRLTITDNKFITVWADARDYSHCGSYGYAKSLWVPSGQTLKRADITISKSMKAYEHHEISQAFIREIDETRDDYDYKVLRVYHYW